MPVASLASAVVRQQPSADSWRLCVLSQFLLRPVFRMEMFDFCLAITNSLAARARPDLFQPASFRYTAPRFCEEEDVF